MGIPNGVKSGVTKRSGCTTGGVKSDVELTLCVTAGVTYGVRYMVLIV